MPNAVIFRTLFLIFASLLIAACSSNAKHQNVEKPNVLKQEPSAKETKATKTTTDNEPNTLETINISALIQRMLDSGLSPWSSRNNAYVFYAGGMLTATLDDNKKLLKVLPDPIPDGQKACLFKSNDATTRHGICQALLSELNQLIP